jgi:hypothetical protein
MSAKKVLILVLALSIGITATAWAGDTQATDYSKPKHWLALPVVVDKKVDVFYLYPTSWHKLSPDEPGICKIDNPTMLAGAKVSYGKQATAFEPVGNVYAPYYRQIDLSPVDREKRVGGLPTKDAVAAFDYYIKHYNHGRPFILAGHSQGSNILCNLLAGYLKDHPEVYARMIAAYVIGYSVTESYLAANPHLKFAQGPDDTGVIVSYNTEASDVAPGTNPVTLPGGIAINPITWTRDETLVPAAQNLGSIMPADGVFVPVMHYADARVDKTKGVVICSTAGEDKLSPPLPELRGVYHSYDYPFYYYNLRQNAANRVEHYLNRHSQQQNTITAKEKK